MNGELMISTIVCQHKGTLYKKAIESLRKQNTRHLKMEIILVVSDPDFESDWDDVMVIVQEGQPAIKRNVGAQHASGEYLAYFDDDIEADEDAVYEMYKVLKNKGVGMVFGKLKKMDRTDIFDEAGGFLTNTGFIWARADGGVKDVGQFEKTEQIFAGKSAACMIKKKIQYRVYGFDKRMGILGEESDLAWRVWLAGHKVMYAPKSVTLHAFGTRFKPQDFYTSQRIYYNGCRNYLTMLYANLEPKNALRIIPINFMCWVLAGIGMAFSFKFEASKNIFKGLWFFLTQRDYLKHKRLKTESIRVVTDKYLFTRIMKKVGAGYYFKRFLRYLKIGLHG